MEREMTNTVVFIDGAYLSAILRNRFDGVRIDLAGLVEAVASDDVVLQAYYYDCLPIRSNYSTPEEEKRFLAKHRFFSAIARLPNFTIRLGTLVFRNGKFMQKGVDVALSIDLVRFSVTGQIDKAIIIAGDADFIPAIRAAKNEGVHTVLYCSSHNCSPDLYDAVDCVKSLDTPLIDSVALRVRELVTA